MTLPCWEGRPWGSRNIHNNCPVRTCDAVHMSLAISFQVQAAGYHKIINLMKSRFQPIVQQLRAPSPGARPQSNVHVCPRERNVSKHAGEDAGIWALSDVSRMFAIVAPVHRRLYCAVDLVYAYQASSYVAAICRIVWYLGGCGV